MFMPENLLSLNSTLNYFDAEQKPIAISDKDFKFVWINKQFRILFPGKRLKGISLFKILSLPDSLILNPSDSHIIPLNALNSNLKIVPLNNKNSKLEGNLIKIEPYAKKNEKELDNEILQNNLLFQKELQNTLNFLLKEKSLRVI